MSDNFIPKPAKTPASRLANDFANYLSDCVGVADLELAGVSHLEIIHAPHALNAARALGIFPRFDVNGSRSIDRVTRGLDDLPALDLQSDEGHALAQYLSIQLTKIQAEQMQKRYRLWWLSLSQGVSNILDWDRPSTRAGFEALWDEFLLSPTSREAVELWENSVVSLDDVLHELMPAADYVDFVGVPE